MGRVAQKECERKRSASSCQRLDKLFTKLRRKDEGAGKPEGPGEASRAEVIEIDSDSEQQRESSNSAVTSSSTQSTGK